MDEIHGLMGPHFSHMKAKMSNDNHHFACLLIPLVHSIPDLCKRIKIMCNSIDSFLLQSPNSTTSVMKHLEEDKKSSVQRMKEHLETTQQEISSANILSDTKYDQEFSEIRSKWQSSLRDVNNVFFSRSAVLQILIPTIVLSIHVPRAWVCMFVLYGFILTHTFYGRYIAHKMGKKCDLLWIEIKKQKLATLQMYHSAIDVLQSALTKNDIQDLVDDKIEVAVATLEQVQNILREE